MSHDHPLDIHIQADGSEERREPWVVTGSEVLTTAHAGSVCVHEGAAFELASGGRLSGSLALQAGSSARIIGQHSGSLYLGAGAVVDVLGSQSGSVRVDHGGLVRVHPGGKLAGSLDVAGLIENRGTRGGSVRLTGGAIEDLDGALVKQPVERDGMTYYSW